MLEVALVVYAAIAMFFLLMSRSEKRRTGEKNTISGLVLSLAWPGLLIAVAIQALVIKLRNPSRRREAQRPVKLETQKSN
ncbi:MAG: hypothetical protein P0Y65_05425 [Candidatus Devosia phytovorans]|uniref:Uncharacterized protein n=1 Tax=Candidatus Devosia phytovorans TaxID=3121372 RepID=A0AAJ5VWW7_9HYPH|nr:hypothetical protein [Devosia sp.]WEK05695.1 MAG: hypothetical protein P0Y65_05425 [Devosia sp.]